MTFLTGTSSASLLDTLCQITPPATLAVTGAGVVLFLQAVAYVLVSLAAIAVLLRYGFGQRRGAGNCKCSGGEGHDAEPKAERHSCCNGSAKAAKQVQFHHGQDAAAAVTNGASRLHNAETEEPEVPHGEPRSLSRGRLPERCVLPSVTTGGATAAEETGSAAAHIRAAGGNAPAAQPAQSAEEAEAEQRRITAVIAAAVHNVLGGQPHRIVRIEPLNQSWAQEGRRDIFSSHRIR